MVFCCFGCVSKKVSGCWFLALLEAAAAVKMASGGVIAVLRHFRHEIRWCFAVSAQNWLMVSCFIRGKIGDQNWTKLAF